MTGETGPSELLGVARVDLLVNTDQWNLAIQQGETRLSRMTQAALDDYGKLNGAEKRRVDSLLKQVEAIGKTREQQLLANAAYAGLTKYPALFDELRNRVASAADATKKQADNAKQLGESLKSVSFTDAQLYKGNQALAEFSRRAEAARQASLDQASAAEVAARRSADAQMKAAQLTPAQLFKGNVGLSGFLANAEANRQAQQEAAAADAADAARRKEMIRLSLEQVEADQRLFASQQRSVVMTDAQREAVDRIKASQQTQADINARGQRILEAEARARAQAAASTKGENDELRKLLGQIDPTTAAYERLDRMEEQLRAHRKSGALSESDYQQYAKQIDKARQSVEGTDEAVHRFSLNSNAARREFGVLAGELARGNFGDFKGSLITLANNTGLLASLLWPTAIGVAAVGAALVGLGVAAADAYREEQRLNEAVALSGNYAGVTAGSFEKMASGIGGATGHLSEARDVLNSLVASGRVGAASLEAVGQAGFDIAILTKKGAEEAAQAATQMFDGTVASLLKANEQYHFLSEATYEQVKALEEQGTQQEAVRVAAEAFHDAVTPRIQAMTDGVYGLARAWQEARKGTSEWYETFKNGASLVVGTASLDTQIAALEGRKQEAKNAGLNWFGRSIGTVVNPYALMAMPGGKDLGRASVESWSDDDQKRLDALRGQRDTIQKQAEDDARRSADQAAVIASDRRIDQMAAEVDKASQLKAAIKALDADYETLWGKSDGTTNKRLAGVERIVEMDGSVSFAGGKYDTLRKDLEKKFSDNSASKLSNADAAAQLSSFKSSLSQYTDAYANAQRELDAQRKSGAVSEEEYFERSRQEVNKAAQAQIDAIQGEIALLQKRSVAGADKARNDAQISALSDQLHKVEADAISKVNVLTEQEAASKAKSTAAINAYIAALGQQTAARQAEIDLQVAAVGMGDKEFAMLQRVNRIRQESADQQVKLTKQLNTVGEGGIDQATYNAKVDQLKKETEARVQAELDGQNRIDAARSDWQNAGYRAMDQFRDRAMDTAGTFGSFIESTYGSLTDYLTQAETTGSLSVKGLVSNILKEAARLANNQIASQLLGFGLNALLGGPALSKGDNLSALKGSVADDIANFKFNALGGVYDTPSLSSYSNKVYDSPQVFAFAKGAGVFGEAGPEAIVPLVRSSDGHLGVRQLGGGGGGTQVNVTVNVDSSGNSSSQVDASGASAFAAEMGQQMQAVAEQVLARNMRPGGKLWRAGAGR